MATCGTEIKQMRENTGEIFNNHCEHEIGGESKVGKNF